jgi:mannose-6-phosphate isomerase-like protein (cupin superfamily)
MNKMKEVRKTKRVLVNPIYKDKATVLKTSDETNGEYSLGQLEVYPGGGNGMHIHTAFTETFTAIKGTLGVMLRDKKIYLTPGDSLTVPLQTPHHFFNDNKEAIVCNIKLQPGHDGFEKGIAIAYGLATDGKVNKKGVPKSIAHLALVMMLTDTYPAGILGLLRPLFKRIATRARKKGIEKELLEKYYYD